VGVEIKHHVELAPVAGPLPLGALYFLMRGADAFAVDAVLPFDPRVVWANAFVPCIRTRSRMLAQLDVAERVARHVPAFTVRVPHSMDSAALADLLLAHMSSVAQGTLAA
jgi:hypothetical protein